MLILGLEYDVGFLEELRGMSVISIPDDESLVLFQPLKVCLYV